ncbi:ribonuclease P [Candidatus Woesearchaeota archaeon]|nr:ribonuclease P [Candidatus Woesearchaeota archaeon]
MARRYSRDKEKEKKIAKEHINELFEQAKEAFGKDPSLSDKYVKQARTIQMKFRLRMPPEYKKSFCKHCYKYLVPSKNCRVRVSDGKVVYYCESCKKFMRFPYKK